MIEKLGTKNYENEVCRYNCLNLQEEKEDEGKGKKGKGRKKR